MIEGSIKHFLFCFSLKEWIQHLYSQNTHTLVFSTVPCVCTFLSLLSAVFTSFLSSISLLSCQSNVVYYSCLSLIFLLNILKNWFGEYIIFLFFNFSFFITSSSCWSSYYSANLNFTKEK